MSSTVTPRIYVACLASYNSGDLHGAWIDATQDVEAIREEIHQILKTSPEPNVILQDFICSCGVPGKVGSRVFHKQVDSPKGLMSTICPECDAEAPANGEPYRSAEEWAVHDFEGFGHVNLGEYPDIEAVAQLAECIEENGLAFTAYLDYIGGLSELENAKDHFEDAYRGTWKNLEEYVEDEARSIHEIPDWLDYYIDWEKMARDRNDLTTVDADGGEIYVFDTNV